jgi:hypothetical protein
MQALRSIDERKREALLGGLALVTVEAYVDRLVGDDYDRAKMVDWLALVFRWSDQPDQIPMLFDILPAHDDTTTVFSNGWAANYAKYIVELLHGGEETKQGEAVGPT